MTVSTLLVLVFASFLATAGRAQVAYNFERSTLPPVAPDDVPAVTGAGRNILTMDCLAANGYGQWTSSSSTTNANSAASCFLLSNRLTPSTTNDAQAGILGARTFQFEGTDVYPTEAIKCAANLKGNVRYVWIDNTTGRDKFYVEGFDPATSIGASTGIGIDFAYLPATNSKKILKDDHPIKYLVGVIASTHSLVTSTNEPLFADMFDVAIDADNVYIVWEEYVSGTYSIRAASVNLNGGTYTATLLGAGGLVAHGQKPTVSVDVRNSGNSNIDVSYISGGQVQWAHFSSGTWTITPVGGTVNGQTWLYTNPTHARIVDASAAGSGSTDKAIYFIAEDNAANKCLFFRRITSGALSTGNDYCDGTLNTTRAANCPIETSAGFKVVDDYIRAFANPYQGNTTAGSFDGFHCLYTLDHSAGTINPSSTGGSFPLMIIPNNSPGSGYCVSGGHGTGDFPYNDPVKKTTNVAAKYVGAVNQMGIHVHWTGLTSGDHLYRRDLRFFDQDIEENTLVTDTCKVADGSGHGGSLTPTLLLQHTMTMYSDPSTQAPYSGSANLVILAGSTSPVTLKIGDGSTNVGGCFKIVGCRSQVNLVNNTLSKFRVNSSDSVVAYSYFVADANGSATFNGGIVEFVGSGQAELTNLVGYSYVSSIATPVTLIMHGNARLKFDDQTLTMTDVSIPYRYETSVTGSGNHTGVIWSYGDATFTDCRFVSDDNTNDNPIYNSRGGYTDQAHSTTFNNCYFSVGSHTYIQAFADVNPSYPGGITISGGYSDAVGVYANFARFDRQPVSVDGMEFENIRTVAVSFQQDPATTVEYSFNVSNCYFGNFKDLASYPNPEAIKVTDCTNSAWRTDINVQSNLFVQGSGGEADGSIQDAIHFQDAIGDIGYNTIGSTTSHATKYQRGIWNESSSGSSHNNSNTLICSNSIVGLNHNSTSTGLSTDYYIGYAKLNTISYCYIGQTSATLDAGHVIFSTYSNHTGAGFAGSNGSQTDFAGVHHPTDPSIDVAAYNSIASNNLGGAQITLDQTNQGLYGYAKAFFGQAGPNSGSWMVYGDNCIGGSPNASSTATVNIADVSNNYWGGGSFSGTNITFTDPSDLSSCASGSALCSGGLIFEPKGAEPQSFVPLDTAMSRCDYLLSIGYGYQVEGRWKESYDTLRLFIEQCPFYVGGKYNAGAVSWDAFKYVNGSVSGWGAGGIGRWPDYLIWLKKVLYLNPDTTWYCSDVLDMFTALQGTGSQQSDAAAQMAVAKYVVESGKCPAFAQFYNSASAARRQAWLDSLTLIYQVGQNGPRYQDWDTATQRRFTEDTTQHPYDSTIPSLYKENLQILLGPQNAVMGTTGTSSMALLDARLLDNPTSGEIALSFEMGRTALVTMELLDVLGHSIPIENAKYQLEQPGTHEARIPAMNLPPGTYYLRLTTDTGETRTLKAMKE